MQDYMRIGPDGDPVLDFANLTRDQAAALQEVTVESYMDGGGENAREVKKVRFKLADKGRSRRVGRPTGRCGVVALKFTEDSRGRGSKF
jgi:hypothetical protein